MGSVNYVQKGIFLNATPNALSPAACEAEVPHNAQSVSHFSSGAFLEKMCSEFPMNKLSLALVGILGPLSVFFVFLGLFTDPMEGLWMNLGTEFAGVLVTVLVVDRIIQRHQTEQWSRYRDRGIVRCRVLCNALLSSLRSAGGWPPDFSLAGEKDEKNLHRKIVQFANEHIAPNALRVASQLNQKSWDVLHRNLANVVQEIEAVLLRFGPHLTPQQHESLDAVSHSLNRATIMPTTFKEMFDPEYPRQDIRGVGVRALADSIQEIIHLTSQLSAALESSGK